MKKTVDVMGYENVLANYLTNPCYGGKHKYMLSVLTFSLKGMDIPNGTPCDCGRVLWNVEISCEHCKATIFKEIPNPSFKENDCISEFG